jgi:hypothetical protein
MTLQPERVHRDTKTEGDRFDLATRAGVKIYEDGTYHKVEVLLREEQVKAHIQGLSRGDRPSRTAMSSASSPSWYTYAHWIWIWVRSRSRSYAQSRASSHSIDEPASLLPCPFLTRDGELPPLFRGEPLDLGWREVGLVPLDVGGRCFGCHPVLVTSREIRRVKRYW